MKKATIPKEKRSLSQGNTTIGTAKAPTKISRVLAYLLQDRSLNRFEAERLGDHCLHSTISSLTHGYGLNFARKSERVPNHWGLPCQVTRYSLPLSERKRASNVLKILCNIAAAKREVAA
ncbi:MULTISPECIES: hypothetical protein [Pseudomonas]|jgi:hypothetical protein|uniref:Uncharacterized protein n=2 Tax=Pseudomonas TaxID=286 RepID=A0A646NXA4_9PSED|nr:MULTISPECIES: hypothetical protein [Pseudomonas]KRP48712.1 hypothetical protein TU73_01045 [Pseudomonas libanensis]MBV2083020.1 hypothetical protein [Pseudomonas carnis]MBV2085118.1 hypothetical protein [Pseudomonas carnis]MDO3688696.1 hypothetical protein [Pseudomonas sp. DKN 2791]MDO7034757.1 hypothetical protein [Pseudomonas sp. DKN 2792]